jgi:hypothetical protein
MTICAYERHALALSYQRHLQQARFGGRNAPPLDGGCRSQIPRCVVLLHGQADLGSSTELVMGEM